jgi:hypothetical protein
MTMNAALLAGLSTLALLGCAPAEAPQPPQPAAAPVALVQPAPREEPRPVPDSAAIAGQWDVVSFEGYRPARLRGTIRAAYADFDATGVSLRIECNYSGRGGTVSNGRFLPPKERGGMQTVMSCGPERNDRESRYFSFFEKSPTVEQIDPNRLRLRVGETELLLERPSSRRLNFVPTAAELEGKWRMLEVTHYLPEGGYAGGGLSEVPGRFVFSGDRLTFNRCPQYALTFRLSEDGRLEKTGGTAPAQDARGCKELSGPPPAPRMPGPADVLGLLHSSPLVERTENGAILLSTDRLGLLITKEPCESVEQSSDHRTTRVTDCAPPE